MEEYRSKSYGDGRMEMESYYGPPNGFGKQPTNGNGGPTNYYGYTSQDLRCYSASYASSTTEQPPPAVGQIPRELKKGKSTNGSSSSKGAWCFSDPEMQRKKRVASYKAYTVEGKIKRSFSKSFRWLKDRFHMAKVTN